MLTLLITYLCSISNYVLFCINSDIVVNMDNVFLYSCPKKLEFLEKGYCKYSHFNFVLNTHISIDLNELYLLQLCMLNKKKV